jgi:TIR domain-containing protein/putative peptidoglycan binding protein
MAHDVFICYSARDKPTADAVCAVLESEGVRCWIAPRDILPGVDWGESIIDAINDAQVMVLIFSSHANAAQSQIKREVERAVNKGMSVIPLRIEDVLPTKSLEYFLSSPHWLDAFTPPLEDHARSLAGSIKRLLDKRAGTTTESPPPSAAVMAVATAAVAASPVHRPAAGKPASTPIVSINWPHIAAWAKQPLHLGMMLGAMALVLVAWFVLRPTATAADQQAWNMAADANSIPAYELYIREQPEGYYRDKAQDRVTSARAETEDAWSKAKAQNTSQGYKAFLDQYARNGIDLDEARDALSHADEEEREARGLLQNRQQILQAAGFYRGSANGIASTQSTDAVKALQRSEGLPATGNFDDATIAALSRTAQRNQAVSMAYDQATATHSRAGYEKFLAQYGSSGFVADVRQRLAACHTQTAPVAQTLTTRLNHDGAGDGTDAASACSSARNSAVADLSSTCSADAGRIGAVRVSSQMPQNASVGGQIVGSFLSSTFLHGRAVNMGSQYKCTVQMEADCLKSTTSMRTVDICP